MTNRASENHDAKSGGHPVTTHMLLQQTESEQELCRKNRIRQHWHTLALIMLLLLGLGLRLHDLDAIPFWVDEAESSINAYTILRHGYPTDSYLGQPIYENALILPWEENAEYEFRDISYSNGMAVYHGWLPLYSIAAAFRVFNIGPDEMGATRPQHGASEWRYRTWVARLPSVLFGVLSLVGLYLAGSCFHSRDAGVIAVLIGACLLLHIQFSQQARYYAATMAATSFCAWSVAQIVRRHRWIDFVLGGIFFSLLFHCHLFSFVVAGAVLLIGLVISRPFFRDKRIPKLIAFAGVSAALCLPWVIATDLLRHSTGIPMAWRLMSLPRDLFVLLERFITSEYGIVLVTGGALLIAGTIGPRWLVMKRLMPAVYPHRWGYGILYLWLIVAYFGFHFLIPAASFFMIRMALTLLIPTILLVAMLLLSFAEVLSKRYRIAIAGAVAVLFVLVSDQGVPSSAVPDEFQVWELEAAIEHLEQLPIRSDTKLYATPTDHPTLTSSTGLPIQTIAPVGSTL